MSFEDKDKYYKSKGIYIIKNKINNKVYVGSTFVKFSQRFILHKSRLNRNTHHSPHLQNAWNKYGEDAFEFKVIEILDNNEEITLREEYWINEFNAVLNGYNVTKLVEGRRFKKHTKATIAKMNKYKYKEVCQYDLSGNFIRVYPSLDSTKENGFNPKCVSECVCGRRDSHKKFRFKYKEANYKEKIPYLNNYIKHTVQDLYTKKIYQTMVEAALDLNVNPNTIKRWVIKGIKFRKLI